MLKGDAPPTRKEFAKRLRNRRRDAGYRHARHFAKAIGVSETRYTKWERAETEPDITHINKLAGALKCNCNDLICLCPQPEPGE